MPSFNKSSIFKPSTNRSQSSLSVLDQAKAQAPQAPLPPLTAAAAGTAPAATASAAAAAATAPLPPALPEANSPNHALTAGVPSPIAPHPAEKIESYYETLPESKEQDRPRHLEVGVPPSSQATTPTYSIYPQLSPSSATAGPQQAETLNPDSPADAGRRLSNTFRRGDHHHPLQDTKKSKRSFFSFGSSSKEGSRQHQQLQLQQAQQVVVEPSAAHGNGGAVHRRISLRRKDSPGNPRLPRHSPTEASGQFGAWPSGQTSAPYLPPNEAEEVGEADETAAEARANGRAAYQLQPQPDHSLQHTVSYTTGSVLGQQPPLGNVSQATITPVSSQSDHGYGDQLQPRDDNSPAAPPGALPQQQQQQQQQAFRYQHSQQQQQQPPEHYQAYQPPQPGASAVTQSEMPRPDYQQQQRDAYQQRLDQPLPAPPQQQQQAQQQQQQQQQQYSGMSQQPLQNYSNSPHGQSGQDLLQPSQTTDGGGTAMPGQVFTTRRPGEDLPPGNNSGGLSRESSTISAYGQGYTQTPHAAGLTGQRPAVSTSGVQNYRGGHPQAQLQQSAQGGQLPGEPARLRPKEDGNVVDASVYHELQGKYSKVKKLYFEKTAQVEQLQNTLANQRLSQSRTCLDDNEYTTRFGRLNGAIENLAFNIRKDWRCVPSWLQPVISEDACAKGMKEMTVVGRAFISRWIVDELLDRYFHPGIEPSLSLQLKNIEKNIRRFAPPQQTVEEEQALLAKISAWRLTTIEGLPEIQPHSQDVQHRTDLTRLLEEQLMKVLVGNLNDPPPAGLLGGISTIVELAVGLSANLHLESRDVFVHYPLPGSRLAPDKVKVETGLPPLGKSAEALTGVAADRVSLSGADVSNDSRDGLSADERGRRGSDSSTSKEQPPGKRRLFGGSGGLISKKMPSTSPSDGASQKSLQANSGGQQGQAQSQRPKSSGGGSVEEGSANASSDAPAYVRVAGFMSVEVRGRSVLVKAPVWTL